MQTLETLFEAYLAEMVLEHAPRTQYQQTCFYRSVVRIYGALPLATCTPDVVRQWKAAWSRCYGRSTVHKYLSFLSCAFAYGVEIGWLDANPLAKVRKPSPAPHRLRFLQEDERVRLVLACRMSRNPLLYPLVMLALGTGGRKNELRRLQWPQVDLEAGTVRNLGNVAEFS